MKTPSHETMVVLGLHVMSVPLTTTLLMPAITRPDLNEDGSYESTKALLLVMIAMGYLVMDVDADSGRLLGRNLYFTDDLPTKDQMRLEDVSPELAQWL